jgi:hypothetical protein
MMKGIGTPSSSNMIERIGIASYEFRQTMITLSRCFPPIVAAKLAQNAPINRARKVQYIECATALRAVSAACVAWVNMSSTLFSASGSLIPVLAATTCTR